MGSTSPKKNTAKLKIKNFVSWFEIPAINFNQALNFYNHIYGIQMETISNGEYTMAFFPVKTGIGGAIVAGPASIPGETGPLIYLNGGEDLNDVLGRVEEAGGRIIMGKTLINEDAGHFALFIDCEGNKLALHSNK